MRLNSSIPAPFSSPYSVEMLDFASRIVALHWNDVDFARGQICVRYSDWRGQLTAPKNSRIRRVEMTQRLAAALREHRHLRSPRVLCEDDGTPLTRQGAWSRVRYAARRAGLPTGVHILRHSFSSFWRCGRAREGNSGAPWASRPDDDAAVYALESGSAGVSYSVIRAADSSR